MREFKPVWMQAQADSRDEYLDLVARARALMSLMITIELSGGARLAGDPGQVTKAVALGAQGDPKTLILDIQFDGFAVSWLQIEDAKEALMRVDADAFTTPQDQHGPR